MSDAVDVEPPQVKHDLDEIYYYLRHYIAAVAEGYQRSMIVESPPGVGKCISLIKEDDYVITGNGRLTHLDETPDSVITLEEDNNLTKAEVNEKFERTVDETYELKTYDGRRIRLTPEHPLLTLDGWKRADEVEKEYIAVPNNYPEMSDDGLSKELNTILGYLLAEGGLTGGFAVFTNGDDQAHEEFKKAVKEFDSDLQLKEGTKKTDRRVVTDKKYANTLTRRLKELGIMGLKSEEKFVPDEVFEQSNERIAYMLSALFDGDGCIHESAFEITLKSEILIRQIKHLLLRFGIHSRVKKKVLKSGEYEGNEYWRLSISKGKSMVKLCEDIGFNLDHKQEKLEERADKIRNRKEDHGDPIPRAAEIAREARKLTDVHYTENQIHIGSGTGMISRTKAKEQIEFLESLDKDNIKCTHKEIAEELNLCAATISQRIRNGYKIEEVEEARETVVERKKQEFDLMLDRLKELSNDDVRWVKVEEMNKIEEEVTVYDLEVDHEAHNFVANDVVVHNSYNIQTKLEEEVGESGYIKIAGHTSPLALYQTLHDNSDKVVFLDDCSAVLKDRQAMEIIKAATETDVERREISWNSNASELNDGYSTSFEFSGQIIICANKIPDRGNTVEILNSLIDRSIMYEFDLNYRERMDLIKQIAYIHETDINAENRMEIVNWLEEVTDESCTNINLRTMFKCFNQFRYAPDNWRALVANLINIDPELEFIKQALDEHETVKQARKKYQDEFGKSRASFFRKKAELEENLE